MSWAETKKVNSDLSKPLNVLFEELLSDPENGLPKLAALINELSENVGSGNTTITEMQALMTALDERLTETRTNQLDLLSHDDCGLSAIRHLIDTRLTETRVGHLEDLVDATHGLPALKYNQYISDIKTYGANSYCMRSKNRHLFKDLLANSMTVYGDDTIHTTIVDALTNDELAIMLEDDKAGERLNTFYNTTIFPSGSATDILNAGLSSDMVSKLDTKVNTYLQNSIGAILSASSGVGAYINSDSGLGNSTLAAKATLADVMADSGCVTAIFNNSDAVNKYMTNSVFRAALKASATAMNAVNASTTAINAIKNSKYGKENVKTSASTSAISLLISGYCGVATGTNDYSGSSETRVVRAFAKSGVQYVNIAGSTVDLVKPEVSGGGTYGSVGGSAEPAGTTTIPFSASTHPANQIVRSATQISKTQTYTYTVWSHNYSATCTATGTVTYIPL